MTKKELIDLVKKIMDPSLEESETVKLIEVLEQNVPHPAPSDLIFWTFEDLTPEEIVDRALSYKEEKQ